MTASLGIAVHLELGRKQNGRERARYAKRRHFTFMSF